MFTHRSRVICTSIFFCWLFFASCASSPPATTNVPQHSTSTVASTRISPTSPTPTPSPGSAPKNYTSRVLVRGGSRPDDLVFDQQGHLLFSDFYNGTISRVNANGTATVIFSGLAGPEGLVSLANGTLIVAEQRTNRILSFAPGAITPTILRTLPGTPSTATCKDGVDGIAYDPTTSTLIIPDSPDGTVYRMSTDGKTFTLLASGITRPVGAAVDPQGNIYVADECGGAVWRIAPHGTTTAIRGFGMPDDVAFDAHHNLLVIDLAPSIHALLRVTLATGQRETLRRTGFIEPQGLLVDAQDHIFVSDDYADMIVEFVPS